MNVLIADDDPGSLLVAKAVVEAHGHSCRQTTHGEEAWQRFLAERPDVLITDRDMPVLDGIALSRRIRAHETDTYTYIVMLTGLDDADHVLAGMRAGADDYLAKPLDPRALEARLLAAERVTALHGQLALARTDLARQARTDPLTGLMNRSGLAADFEALEALRSQHESTHSVALCDVDHFKRFNDTYGHQAGDEALRAVSAHIVAGLRSTDRVYRYGGEEFLVLLPQQSLEAARTAIDRVRTRLERAAIAHTGAGPGAVLTISGGVAACPPGQMQSASQLIARADAALYAAKALGRNRVECAPDDTSGR